MSSTASTKLECHLLWPFLRRSSWFCENKVMRWLALQLKGFYSTVYIAISRSWKCFPVLSMKENLIPLIRFFFFGGCFLFSSLHLLLLSCPQWKKTGSFYLSGFILCKSQQHCLQLTKIFSKQNKVRKMRAVLQNEGSFACWTDCWNQCEGFDAITRCRSDTGDAAFLPHWSLGGHGLPQGEFWPESQTWLCSHLCLCSSGWNLASIPHHGLPICVAQK